MYLYVDRLKYTVLEKEQLLAKKILFLSQCLQNLYNERM